MADLKTTPFYYKTYQDLLPVLQFNKIVAAYDTLDFKESYSDLFNFLVSTELNEDVRFDSLKTKLDVVFEGKVKASNPFYTFSASFYRKGDFLLCHDDMVENRLFAFVFYLEDFESGKLLLYENDCETLHKAIDVKANSLVIFKVCFDSFHEVQKCTKDGRKAISGWINSLDESSKILKNVETEESGSQLIDTKKLIDDLERTESHDSSLSSVKNILSNNDIKEKKEYTVLDTNTLIDSNEVKGTKKSSEKDDIDIFANFLSKTKHSFDNSLLIYPNIIYYDLELDLENENFFSMEFSGIKQQLISQKIQGPFFNRRVIEVTKAEHFVPYIQDYKLIHTESLIFDEDCYILCNDKINVMCQDILDVFIFKCGKNCKKFIRYMDNNDEVAFNIESVDSTMVVGKRNGCRIFIHKVNGIVELEHFMYIKI